MTEEWGKEEKTPQWEIQENEDLEYTQENSEEAEYEQPAKKRGWKNFL